jgi:hypothetical protein
METSPQQTAEGMALVRVLAAVLDRLVGANSSLALADPGQVTKFHALKAPGIGIQQYLERYVAFYLLLVQFFYVDCIILVDFRFTNFEILIPIPPIQNSQVCVVFQRMFHPSPHLH